MVGPIKSLRELTRHGGRIKATCQVCKRIAYFDIGELASYFTRKKWFDGWPAFAKRLRCQCGENNPHVAWEIGDLPPDDDPPPPRPRFTRDPKPKGASEEWERAKARREQRTGENEVRRRRA